jgi:hypothetical protein
MHRTSPPRRSGQPVDPSPTPLAPDLRVGDEDRARVTSLLAEHYASGRLDLSELDERSTLALAAVRRHELDALLADLPELVQSGRDTPVASSSRGARPRVPMVLLAALAVVLVVATQGAALWCLPMLWWVAATSRHRHRLQPPTSVA